MTPEKRPFEGPYADWVRARVAVVRETVSAGEVLMAHGHRLRYGGARAEQIFCPFHSNNRTMAAKYHPDEADSSSGVYCFVCQKRWDVIGVWRELEGMGEAKFTAVLRAIERAYGITPPEMPQGVGRLDLGGEAPDELDALEALFEACERRLRVARPSFDCQGYLTLGVLLDRLRGRFEARKVPAAEVREMLGKVLDKIGARCRES